MVHVNRRVAYDCRACDLFMYPLRLYAPELTYNTGPGRPECLRNVNEKESESKLW